MASANSRYSGVAITLHWVMATLILFMIWLGHNMENHEARFQLHKSIGITLLVLTIARIVWRLYNKPPPLPDDVKPLESKLSKLVQFGFYALMLMIPLGGWIMVSVSPFAVPTVLFETVSWPSLPLGRDERIYNVLAFMHGKGATIGFLGLLFLHVVGAVKHEIGHESGVLKRILPGQKTKAPEATKGVLVTLLASLGFFAAVSAMPFLTHRSLATNVTSSASIQPNWIVMDEGKSISFEFSHDGSDYTGRFESWNAQIEFHYYDNPRRDSKVRVEVDLDSAVTGKKLYDDSLRAKEWFDVKATPKAVVTLENFRPYGDRKIIADGILKIKNLEVPCEFDFFLEMDESETRAKLNGFTKFTRKALQLGQDSDPDADWVSEEIVVNVSLIAEKTN